MIEGCLVVVADVQTEIRNIHSMYEVHDTLIDNFHGVRHVRVPAS